MAKLLHKNSFCKQHLKNLLTSLVLICCCFVTKAQYNFTLPQSANSNNNIYNNGYLFKDKTSITYTISNFGKSNVYTKKSKKIGYSLNLQNTVKEVQNGSINLQISNTFGQLIHSENHPFTIKKRGSYRKDYEFNASQLYPGMYVSKIHVFTNRYSDSFQHTFGYEVENITTPTRNPSDLISFWQQGLGQLAGTPANFSVIPRNDIKNSLCNTFEVHFSGVDNAAIYGWLTVPKSGKKIPVIYQIADYMSEVNPEFRRDIAVFTLNTRVSGPSSYAYQSDYNSLGLNNLADKNKYILKGAFLDAVRGWEFINKFAQNYNLNRLETIISGTGLGASMAAFVNAIKPEFKGLLMDAPSFLDFSNTISFSNNLSIKPFPASMFSGYMNSVKNKDAVLETLSYFDVVNFVPYINSPTLVGLGLKNIGTPPTSVYNFYNQLRVAKKEKYSCKDCEQSMDKGFYGLKEVWIKEIFRIP